MAVAACVETQHTAHSQHGMGDSAADARVPEAVVAVRMPTLMLIYSSPTHPTALAGEPVGSAFMARRPALAPSHAASHSSSRCAFAAVYCQYHDGHGVRAFVARLRLSIRVDTESTVTDRRVGDDDGSSHGCQCLGSTVDSSSCDYRHVRLLVRLDGRFRR